MDRSRRTLLATALAAPLLPRPATAESVASPPIVVPIQMQGSRVTISMRIDGQGPYCFMIDTGAFAGLIREDLARSLHLPVTGQTRFKSAVLPLYAAGDVAFGDVFHQSQFRFAGFAGEGLGRGIGGTLSAALLTAVDGELDFEQGQWRIFVHGRGAATDGFVEFDSEIGPGPRGYGAAFLFVRGTLGGKRYRFVLDTGAPGHIELFHDAARASGLDTPVTPFAPVRPSRIDGKGRVSPLVRADVLDLGGGLQLERPLVLLNRTQDERFPGADGILGLGLMRQLDLATDVAAKRVLTRRNGLSPVENGYSRSGIWFDPTPAGVRVAVIGTGSPAAAAGLREGDLLPGIDLPTAVGMLRGPAGKAVTLTVDRDGARIGVALTLADYL